MNRLLAATLLALALLTAPAGPSASAARSDGPIRLLVSGLLEHDLAALDAAARLVGYADGPGTPLEVSVCPGGAATVEHVVEIGVGPDEVFDPKAPQGFLVRSLDDLRASRPIKLPRSISPYHVECLDREGSQFAAIVSDGERGLGIYRYDGRRRTEVGRLADPNITTGLLSGGKAYVDRVSLDVRTGARTRYAKAPQGLDPVAVSPDGRSLAAATGAGDLVVVDAATGRVTATEARRRIQAGVWLDNGRLAVSWQPRGGDALWFVFTRDLRKLRTLRADVTEGFADGNRLLLEVDGRVQRRNRNGRLLSKGRDLPGSGTSIAAVVP